jgi:hypothetical protein
MQVCEYGVPSEFVLGYTCVFVWDTEGVYVNVRMCAYVSIKMYIM